MALNRRDFLKLIGSSVLIASLPAFSSAREPYVTIDSNPVSYIGPNGRGGFIGSKIVKKVLPFDGVGYPVVLGSDGRHSKDEIFYDFDLSDMHVDIPDKFWHSEKNKMKYPNVHTYIREQRFGETVSEAIFKIQNGQSLPKGLEMFIGEFYE